MNFSIEVVGRKCSKLVRKRVELKVDAECVGGVGPGCLGIKLFLPPLFQK